MDGIVYDFSALSRKRANNVDLKIAKANQTVSTVLIVPVSAKEAAAFDKAWEEMSADPGMFNILGWNCATHASNAFRRAGILSGGIPGLDTPDNLYKQLCVEKGGKVTSVSGYVGFSSSGARYVLNIEDA